MIQSNVPLVLQESTVVLLGIRRIWNSVTNIQTRFHMSSESDDQFEAEDYSPNSNDIYRLQHFMRNVKESKRSDKKSLISVKDAIHLEEQKNLEARLEMTESQLAKAKENTLLLMQKLGQAEGQIEEFRSLLEQERVTKAQGGRQQIRYESSQQEQEDREADYKEMGEELESLHKLCDQKDRENERLAMKIKNMGLEGQRITYQLQRMQEEKDDLERQMKLMERKMTTKYLSEQSKGVEIMESQQLSNAVERLIQLLKSTEEYKHFALFAEDAKGVHFLKNIPKRLKNSNILCIPPKKVKLCSCMQLKIDQKLLWTPEQTYKVMQDIKMKYDHLNQESVQQILFTLNQIWLARQESHLKRVRESYENEIKRLKKRNEERYDEVVARKQIQRLKKEVSRAKNKPEKGLVKVENMKMAGQYQDQLRLKDKEVRLLQQKVKLVQSESNGYDKIIYMQGALWIIEKVLSELESYGQSLKQFQNNFIEEINSAAPVGLNSKLNKTYKYFFQNLNELQEGLFEKLVLMQQSTLKKLQVKKSQAKSTQVY